MMSPGGYVLDANVFIEAHRRYYAFDICPGYWGALLTHHSSGNVWSIDHVRDELVDKGDPLSDWAKQAPGSFFVATSDAAVVSAFGSMMTWVQGQAQYSPAAKAEFAQVADGWLAAYAQVQGLTVVTHEAPSPDSRKRVPLPNVCSAFKVNWINTFEMLRTLRVVFK
jgi:hypothetical protein